MPLNKESKTKNTASDDTKFVQVAKRQRTSTTKIKVEIYKKKIMSAVRGFRCGTRPNELGAQWDSNSLV